VYNGERFKGFEQVTIHSEKLLQPCVYTIAS